MCSCSSLVQCTDVRVSTVFDDTVNIEAFTSIVIVEEDTQEKNILVAGSRDGLLVTVDLSTIESPQPGSVSCERLGLMPVHVYPAKKPGSAFVCCDSDFVLVSDFRHGRGFTQKQNVWTIDAEDSSKPSPAITAVTVLPKSLSGNEANIPLLLVATNYVLLAELQPQVGPVQRHIPLRMTPLKLLYSHVLKCLIVAVSTPDHRPTIKFIDPETGDDLSLPTFVDGNQKTQQAEFISGLGQVGDRILCLDEWHVRSDRGNHYYILVSTRGVGDEKGGRVLVVSVAPEKSSGSARGSIRFSTRYKLNKANGDASAPISAIAASDRKIISSVGADLLSYELDLTEKKIVTGPHVELGGPAWKLSLLPSGTQTLALVKGDSLRVVEEAEGGQELMTTHIEGTTRTTMDMLEVAGAWAAPASVPVVSDPPRSIVLLSDQNCSLVGVWIPWENPGQDCESLFEADLPSSVRRLRLGRTLPAWSRGMRENTKFGLLPASVDNAQILGMGIDGSLQSFTLLNMHVWRFLRFVQNMAETSPELYPFTHVRLEAGPGATFDTLEIEGFDPTPIEDRGLEMQVDGDLLLRCLEKRALARLLEGKAAWIAEFRKYLIAIDGGPWPEIGGDSAAFGGDRMLDFAYELLEYFLVPVI